MAKQRFLVTVVGGCALMLAGVAVAGGIQPSSKQVAAQAGVQHAKQQIALYSKPAPPFKAPGPAIPTKGLKGKVVWYVPVLLQIPIFHVFSDGMTAALKHAGVRVRVCNGNGNPVDWGKCINQAVQANAHTIVIDAIPPSLISTSLAAAKKKKIPVILGNLGYPRSTKQTAYASFDYPLAGRLVADLVIADSNGKANVLIGVTTDSSNTPFTIGGMKDEFKKYCPACKVTEVGVTSAQWSTRLQSLTSTEVLRDSSITHVIPEYDGMTPFMAQGLQTAGKNDAKIFTFNANLQQMQTMKSQQQFLFGDVGVNSTFLGWAYADQAMRLMLGRNPVQKYNVPTRVFTRSNIGSLKLTNAAFVSGEWYGRTDYQKGFRKLWGL